TSSQAMPVAPGTWVIAAVTAPACSRPCSTSDGRQWRKQAASSVAVDCGPSGTTMQPASQQPYQAAAASTPLARTRATRSPWPSPCARTRAANASARAASAPYVVLRAPSMIATASGVDAAVSSRRRASGRITSGGELAREEGTDGVDRVEVGRHHFLRRDADAVGLLEELDKLQDAGRVDDAAADQRCAVVERRAVAGEKEVVED